MKSIKTNREEISGMVWDYYNHLTSPMDDMYDEGIIPSCDVYRIEDKGMLCGFYAVDSDNTMLQFYLKEEYRDQSDSIFEELYFNK